jgi:hypothetical protein
MSARGFLVALLRAGAVVLGALAMIAVTSVLALDPGPRELAGGSSLRPWLLLDPAVRLVVSVAAFGLAPWIAAGAFPSSEALTRPALARTLRLVVALWASTWCLRTVAAWIGWETLGVGANPWVWTLEPTTRVVRLALYAAIATVAFVGGARLRRAWRRALAFLARWFLPGSPSRSSAA